LQNKAKYYRYLIPFFQFLSQANDIAIITLDSPVVLSRSVATACLPAASADPDQFVDQDAIVLGWGSTDGNERLPIHYRSLFMVQSLFSLFDSSHNPKHKTATSQGCDYGQLRLQGGRDRW
jgi:Trypsin